VKNGLLIFYYASFIISELNIFRYVIMAITFNHGGNDVILSKGEAQTYGCDILVAGSTQIEYETKILYLCHSWQLLNLFYFLLSVNPHVTLERLIVTVNIPNCEKMGLREVSWLAYILMGKKDELWFEAWFSSFSGWGVDVLLGMEPKLHLC
jgi:hypothetical protein